MNVLENILEGKKYYTFDDVLLKPQKSEVVPSEVNTESYLTKKIKLNIPILSAAMDDVTEEKMATSLALQGGMGVIHKLLLPKDQADMVRSVKKFQSGIILQPTAVEPSYTIPQVYELCERLGYSSFPVTENKKVIGIITQTDYDIIKHKDKTVRDRMTPKKDLITASYKISLENANDILLDKKLSKLILVDKYNHLKGMITRSDIGKRRKYPNACKDKKGRLRVAAAVGVKKDPTDTTLEYRVDRLRDAEVDVLVIDTAHGHSKNVGNTAKFLKKRYGNDIQIVAGNVATKEGTEYLIEKGVDAVKTGVGPGSICTTREMSGVGVPQLSAIVLCANTANEYEVPIIADGGIRNSGDLSKCIAAGAKSVMLGSLLAGTPEAPGKITKVKGVYYKEYSGMGSRSKMMKGSKDRYKQESITKIDKLVPEGIEGRVPMKESVEKVIYDLIGGLRSSMGYNGCRTIKEFSNPKNTDFILCSSSTLRENKTSVEELE